jgi:hypothetical protein
MNDNWMFVGAAFVLTWAVLVGYFVHLRGARRRAQALYDRATGAVTQ